MGSQTGSTDSPLDSDHGIYRDHSALDRRPAAPSQPSGTRRMLPMRAMSRFQLVPKRRFDPTPAIADFEQRFAEFDRFRSELDTAHSLVKRSSRVFLQNPQEHVLKTLFRQPFNRRTIQRSPRAASLMRAQKIDRVDFRVEAARRLTPRPGVDESHDLARALGDKKALMALSDRTLPILSAALIIQLISRTRGRSRLRPSRVRPRIVSARGWFLNMEDGIAEILRNLRSMTLCI
jgi:hypothetical protein